MFAKLIVLCTIASALAAPSCHDLSGVWYQRDSGKAARLNSIPPTKSNPAGNLYRVTPLARASDAPIDTDYMFTVVGVDVDERSATIMSNGDEHTDQLKASRFSDAAPPCTAYKGWCKFPYCAVDEPEWQAPAASSLAVRGLNSCAVLGTCPPPTWPATYRLSESTVVQPCNQTGFFEVGGEWGLTSYDWSNMKDIWSTNVPKNETRCEEYLLEQAKFTKEQNPKTRVFVYRNFELALEWLSSERAAMYDPAKKDYFMLYQNGTHKGEIYNEPVGPGDQYFWNFSNPAAVDYFINTVSLGAGGVANENVDGVFTDDVSGLGQEHPQAAAAMGLTQAQVNQLVWDNNSAYDKLIAALRAHNAYNWQAYVGAWGDGTYDYVRDYNCATYMRTVCDPTLRAKPLLMRMSPTNVTENIASFLIARGDHWRIGHGWIGCSNDPPALDPLFRSLDVGEPLDTCHETTPNIFLRTYTNGYALLDCNHFHGTLHF